MDDERRDGLLAEAARLYLGEGLPYWQVGRQLGVSAATAANWVREHCAAVGRPMPKRHRLPSEEEVAQVVRLVLDEGLSVRAAAGRSGFKPQTVRAWVRSRLILEGRYVERRKTTPEDREEAVRLVLEEGLSRHKAAARLGLGYATVRVLVERHLADYGKGQRASEARALEASAEARRLLRAQAARLRLEEGLSFREIARRIGVGDAEAARLFQEHCVGAGVPVPYEANKHPEEVRAEAVRLSTQEELSYREVARRLGLCDQTVRDWVRDYCERGGLERPRRWARVPAEVRAEAVRLYLSEGLSYEDAAGRVGVSLVSVHKWVREHCAAAGLPVPNRKQAPDAGVREEGVRLVMVEGLSFGSAGARLGVHGSSVRVWVREHCAAAGLPVPSKKRVFGAGIREEAARLVVQEGLPRPEAAARLGVPYRVLWAWTRTEART